MPLNSPIHSPADDINKTGTLYVVATPIGNREDITLRAIRVLKDADWIAAEERRQTRRVLSGFGISGRYLAYHEYNERKQTPVLIDKMKAGESVALVSKAGTPSVSDPGFRLIKAAVESRIDVVPIPGVSAPLAALSASGLPSDSFVFVGFLPKKKGEKNKRLQEVSGEKRTLIFFESPNRIISFLEEIQTIMGDRNSVLCRELTKLHEEILRGPVSQVAQALKDRPEVKGECTLLIEGCGEKEKIRQEDLQREIEEEMKKTDLGISDIARTIARRCGLSKRVVYEIAVRIKNARK